MMLEILVACPKRRAGEMLFVARADIKKTPTSPLMKNVDAKINNIDLLPIAISLLSHVTLFCYLSLHNKLSRHVFLKAKTRQ